MSDKIIIVIGGVGGIGFSICQSLFKNGHKVYLVGRDEKQAVKKACQIDKKMKTISVGTADVIQEKTLEKLFKQISKKNKLISAVINLAGIFEPFGKFEKVPLKDHKKVIEVNLLGSFNLTHCILPIFKKQGFGKIVLFSGGGVGGDSPLVNASSYFTSKGAVSIFTEVLGKELEKDNIQINAILPGQILTKSTKKTFKVSKENLGPVLGPVTESLKKTGGNSVEKVLDLIEFLLSEKSNHISGRTLSAKWDRIDILKKEISEERFKLRRIDGRIYKKLTRI